MFRYQFFPFIALGLMISSLAQHSSKERTLRGITFVGTEGEVCLASAPARWGQKFAMCTFIRLAHHAQDASLLRFHTPAGDAIETGTLSNGVFLRARPARQFVSSHRQRRSKPSLYDNLVSDELNIVIKKKKENQPDSLGDPRSFLVSTEKSDHGTGSLIIDEEVGYFTQHDDPREENSIGHPLDEKFMFESSHLNRTFFVNENVQNEALDSVENTSVSDLDDTSFVHRDGRNGSQHDNFSLNYHSERNFSVFQYDYLNETTSSGVGPSSSPPDLYNFNETDQGEQNLSGITSDNSTAQGKDTEDPSFNEAFTMFVFEVTISPSTWHHLCLSYDQVTNTASCQIDGEEEEVSLAEAEEMSSPEDQRARDNSSMCIGSDHFEGDIVGLETFHDILKHQKNKTYYPCQNGSIPHAQAEITMSSPWMLPENARFLEFSKSDICFKERFQDVVLREVGGYHQTSKYCRALGGHLPSFEEVLPGALDLMSEHGLVDGEGSSHISWLNTNQTKQRFVESQCRALTSDFVETEISCAKRLETSICVTQKHRVTLYGHEGTYFDYFFHVEVKNGEVKWTGLHQSLIRRDSSNWVLESSSHSTKMYLVNKTLPIGRHGWVFSLSPNSTSSLLTLSLCKTYEFSCDDGSCLPIAQRCDDVFQCDDNSDEVNCDVLSLPSSYKKFYEPPPRPGEVVPSTLHYDVEVYHLGTITTDEGKANMDLAISVAWFDPRLDFTNLKVRKKNYFDCDKVWKPSIKTLTGNGDGSVVTTNFYEEQCYTMPLDQQPSRNLTDPWMGHSASGLKYPLQYHIGLRTTVPCDFDLVRYPFDRQVCNASFMLMNAPDSRVFRRSKEGVHVRYLNEKRLLLEYELVNVTTESSRSMQGLDNNAYFVVSYHMERLYGYHILNSFFPSLLMALVSYSTFYYKINDFYDRILVSLTAHFILASQFIAVTNNSTKTPYLKLIDVWYAVIMTFCFMVIIVQVGINALMHCQTFPDWLRDRIKVLRFSQNKITPAAGKVTQHGTNIAYRNTSHVTHGVSPPPVSTNEVSGPSFTRSTFPEVEGNLLSPSDAFGHNQARESGNNGDHTDVLELDDVMHRQAHDQLQMKFKRNSIMSLTFSARIPVTKILAVTTLKPSRESQAKQNLNKVGPAVASARLANFIAKILMLVSILMLLIAYFMVVTKFLE